MLTYHGSNAALTDGEVVLVRPLRPGDATAVLALHGNLGEHDTYLRFFGKPAHLDSLTRRIAESPCQGHGAVGAFRRDRLVGVAHYETAVDPTEAEVALAVDGGAQAHGVGTLLLEHIVSIAKRYGIRRFTGTVLAENSRMLRVFADLGLPYEVTPGGPEREFTLLLDPDERYWAALAERERVADSASLRSVLTPDSVAVVGAGRRPGSAGHAVLTNLIDGGYTGRLFAVNPRADSIAGVPCAPTVGELPECPELAVICVPAAAVPGVVEECGSRGVRAAVVISAGLTDTGLGDGVRATAVKYGMRLVGPNCVGVANTGAGVRLNATFVDGAIPEGRVGVVSQSGGFGIALLESMRGLGIGISTMVSTGDKYDVSGNDLLLWWLGDAATDVAVLYLESFGNPRKFGRLARMLATRKPVVAIRTGDTEVARRAAASHTAAAATPAVTRDALYEQAGVIAVDTVTELVGVIAALSWQPLPRGPRVAVLSNAGGAGVLAADACDRYGLTLPEFGADTTGALRGLLPDQASVRNPVDTTAGVDADTFGACLDILLADEAVDTVLVATVPTALGDPGTAIAPRAGHRTKPVFAVRLGQLSHVAPLADAGGSVVTASYADPAAAAAAIGPLAAYTGWRSRPNGSVPEYPDLDVPRASSLVRSALREGRTWLDPLTCFDILRCFGIPVVDTGFAVDEDAAVEEFLRLRGPVALKAHVEGVLHKSAGGAVALGVADAAGVRDTVRGWRGKFGEAWRGVALQPMIERGRELLVGINSDPVFGPLVVLGLGGTDTDLIADRAARLAPLTDVDADRLIEGLRCSAELLRPGVLDSGAIREVVLRVSRLAELLPEVAELDINPLVLNEQGCLALDARIRVEPRDPMDPFLRTLGGRTRGETPTEGLVRSRGRALTAGVEGTVT